MISTDQFTRTGRRVIDMRQPKTPSINDESNGATKDHAFKPSQLTATTATVTPGIIYDRFGTARNVTGATDWAAGVIDFASIKRWYVQIKYLASPPESIGTFDEMLWVGTAGAFPDFRPSEFVENIPILEFPSNTWSSLIRRQTNDVITNAFRHNSLFNKQGGLAPDEYYHLNAAQHTIIDTITDGGAGLDIDHSELGSLEWVAAAHTAAESPAVENAPDHIAAFKSGAAVYTTGAGVGSLVNHSSLADVVSQTVGDDHRGNRTAATGIGTPARHPYIHANGDATRNAMTDGANIGDKDGVKSVSPSLRQLFLDATTVAVDWVLRKLSGGVWAITDTTAAGSGATAGALIVDGGVRVAKGIYVKQIVDGTAVSASSADNSIVAAIITNDEAASFGYGFDQAASICNGTYSFSATGDDGNINAQIAYYVNDTKVIGAQGAAVADATDSTDVITQLNALLARLRTHGLIASS
jgi:hypothetical protein